MVSLRSYFLLCLTSGESRIAVNNKTAHSSVNSVIQDLFHLPYSTPPQRWNEAFFTLSPYPKAVTWTKKIMGLVWTSWCAQRTPKDLPYRYAWSADADLVGSDRTAGPVSDTKAEQNNWWKSPSLLNPSGGFLCVKLYSSSRSTISIFTYI